MSAFTIHMSHQPVSIMSQYNLLLNKDFVVVVIASKNLSPNKQQLHTHLAPLVYSLIPYISVVSNSTPVHASTNSLRRPCHRDLSFHGICMKLTSASQ